MLISNILLSLSILFANLSFAGDDGDEVMKSFDLQMDELELLLKSKDSDEDDQPSFFDKEKMKVDEDEDDSDEDEEEDEEDEDEKEEKSKGKKKSEKMCGKMKKSMGSFIEDYDEVLDGNEILKSFTSTMETMIDVVSNLTSRLDSVENKIDKSNQIVKSVGSVVSKSGLLIKSSKEAIEKYGNAPVMLKGMVGGQSIPLSKSFQPESNSGSKNITVAQAEDFLMKSKKEATDAGDIMKADQISRAISKWEMANHAFDALPKFAQDKLTV